MRVMLMQVPYPAKGEAHKVLDWQIAELKKIQPGETDLIIFPENSNCTGYLELQDMMSLIAGHGADFVNEMRDTAIRCRCTVMSGLMNIGKDGILRNQLTVFTPEGDCFSPYTKVHLVEPEIAKGIEAGTGATYFDY